MVRLATPSEESKARIDEAAPTLSVTPHPSAIPFDAAFEDALKKLVAEAVTEHIAKITEVAATRAITALNRPSRVFPNHTLIRDLPLPTRVTNGLHRMGVRTLGELTSLRAEDILLSPNMGARSLEQLRHILGLLGRSLSESHKAQA